MADEIPPRNPDDWMARAVELIPWLRFLPEDAREEFFTDVINSVQESLTLDVGDTRTAERLVTELAAWKATAEVHSDPELYAALTRPLDPADFVEAPRPELPVRVPGQAMKPNTWQPKKHRPQCGASVPHEDAEDGYYWCTREAGHTGTHVEGDDPVIGWSDGEIVEVYTVEDVRAVPHHVHDFVGDEDTCVREPGCKLTWGEYKAQKREWDARFTIQDEVLQAYDIPQVKIRSPRPLCPSNIPSKPDRADWCMLSGGHTGDHRSREGRTWTDAEVEAARSFKGVSADYEIVDEVAEVQGKIPQQRSVIVTNYHGPDGLTSCGGGCCEPFKKGQRMGEEDDE
jgi:hypothetical protein